MRKILALVFAALVLVGCTITIQPLGAQAPEEEVPVSQPEQEAEPTEEVDSGGLPTFGGWSCLNDPVFKISVCETKKVSTEDQLFWTMSIVCRPDGATTQFMRANTNDALAGDPAADWVLWQEPGILTVSLDGSVEQWESIRGPDRDTLWFWTGSNSSQSAWKFLSAIAPVRSLGVEAIDANGIKRSVVFDVADSVTAAAFLSIAGCSGSGPGA